MGLSIREKADHVATFRYICVYLMETLARWVPTTPELEVKVLFGRHLWDLAQHADAFGKRTAELRLGLQQSRTPTTAYRRFLEAVAGTEVTARRVGGYFDVVLPDLEARYRHYLAATDQLLDEPTVRILERVLGDLARMQGDRGTLAAERPDLALQDPAWAAELQALAAAAEAYVDFRPAPKAAEVA